MAMKKLFTPVLCFLLCGSGIGVFAQPGAHGSDTGYVFRNLDNKDGLLSNEVYSVTQDKDGFIWIGTRKGLERYDGFQFLSFVDSGQDRTNDDLIVSTLYADDSGDRLLYNQFSHKMQERTGLRHRSGLLFPEKEFKRFKPQFYTSVDGGKWARRRYYLAKSSDNGRVSEGIELIQEPLSEKPYFAFFFTDNKTKKTWVTESGHDLLLFDDSLHKVSDPVSVPAANPLFTLIRDRKVSVRKILIDRNGNLWCVAWANRLYRLKAGSGELDSYDLTNRGTDAGFPSTGKPVWATSVLEDDHGTIWVGTAHAGLLRYQPDSNRFYGTVHRSGDPLSLQYNHEINNLFQDKEENIWVATDKGVSYFNPYRQDFTRLDEMDRQPEQLPESELNGALVDSAGNLLTAYWGGGIKIYNKNLALTKSLHFSTTETNLLWALAPGGDGRTWAGCQHGYIHLLDSRYNLIETLHPAEMDNSTIRCIARDQAGDLYFGLHNGHIVRWVRRENKFLPFISSDRPENMPGSPVLNIVFDDSNRCWAGTLDGLALYDKQKRVYTAFYKPLINMPTPCHGIDRVNDSTLVTGFENAGLYFFNLHSRVFARPPGTGNLAGSVYAVKKDDTGNIWFTTGFDIGRYNISAQTIRLSSPAEGYLRSGFEGNYFVATASEKWLTWTRTEMIGFAPAMLMKSDEARFPVRITGLTVFDKPVFIDSLIKTALPVTLSYQDNFIRISFSNLLFSNAGSTRYFYRLWGVDKEWIDNGSGHIASYTGLAPGRYRFEVTTGSASNKKALAAFELILKPAFWQTIWFRTLLVVICALVVLLVLIFYTRHIRRKSEMKQQIVRTEMMALRAQMNPHFIFNCINSIDALIQSDDKYLATVYLNKFARLIRNILDSSKENTITLKRDLETLQLYVDLERFRNRDNFSVDIRTDETVLQQDLKVPPLIIQPYVENAIHHGLRPRPDGQGKIIIEISRQNDQLRYVIEDNGVGRSAARTNKKYRSYGTEMSLDRLKLFNQQSGIPVVITDLMKDGQAAGTRVEVSLQIK